MEGNSVGLFFFLFGFWRRNCIWRITHILFCFVSFVVLMVYLVKTELAVELKCAACVASVKEALRDEKVFFDSGRQTGSEF